MILKQPGYLIIAGALFASAVPTEAADWSNRMGPGFDRTTSEPAPSLAAGKPKRLWEMRAGGGFSSFVTGGGRAYTVVATSAQGASRETVVAVDRKTGQTIWQRPLAVAQYRNGGDRGVPDNDGGDGPRTTPVFADGRLFVFGTEFDLTALDAATGRVLWQKHLLKDFGGSEISWGNAASPLVMGDRVLVAGGGSGQAFIAFRADNGEVIWKSGNDRATHSTPVLATIHSTPMALFMVERGLVALDPATGKELWHYPFAHRTSTAASPVVWQDIVNVSASYGIGGGACKVTRKGDGWDVEELWRVRSDREAGAHWTTAVAHNGYIFGMYGHNQHGKAPLSCIDIRTGKVMWSQPGFGPGSVMIANDRLLAISDKGQIAVVEPTHTGYREFAKVDVIDGKVWSGLAISDGQLFVRSTTMGVCLEL